MDNSKIKSLSNQAIDSAINNNWDQAIKIYKQIIAIDKQSVDSYLGLGFAFLQLNNIKKAKLYYKKALYYDNTNTIAINNLDKIKIFEKKGKKKLPPLNNSVTLDPNMFINVIGITKVIALTNIGQSDVIAHLKVGEEVFFKIKRRRVEVRNQKNEYIGALPDDISKRLIFFLHSKSKYIIYIKSVFKSQVEVFIKELKKGPKVKKYVSFPKNIQDNLKNMVFIKDDDSQEDSEITTEDDSDSKQEEPEDENESPVNDTDIEWLADNEDYSKETINQDDEDSEEFEE